MKKTLMASILALFLVPVAAHADILETILNVVVDGGNNFAWQKVEIPGTKCGNGSQYKFFLHKTNSPNLLVFFEGGGACWDYETCSGKAGILGAANPNGIPDNYMTGFTAKYVSPIVNGADPGLPFRSRTDLPTKGWSVAFLPYCTGDVHIGNNVVTYNDPSGNEPPLQWSHAGYTNTTSAIDYLKAQFPNIGKMLVTGFSAGGTATSATYYFLRRGLNPQKGYMINDSGPIFLAPNLNYKSRLLHNQITQSWDLSSLFSELPGSFNVGDFGSINKMVAQEFPQDQLSYTAYTRDYNYSRFSYERFYPNMNQEKILNYWKEDQDKLVNEMNAHSNFSYFLPFHRQMNQSHCSTIITFIGSHACQRMEKKHHWWEYLEWPWGQTYKCYSENVSMESFLHRFINGNQRIRIYEPTNWYNAQDPGMKIMSAIVDAALGQ